MLAHRIIRTTLALGFGVSVASVSLARRPPALERLQNSADRALSSCPAVLAKTGDGYRGVLVRLDPYRDHGHQPTHTTPLLAARTVSSGHKVADCAGTRVHSGSGYRDMHDRVPATESSVQVARTTR